MKTQYISRAASLHAADARRGIQVQAGQEIIEAIRERKGETTMEATTTDMDSKLALRDWETACLAGTLARVFDESQNIECWDAKGDNGEFEAWLNQWDAGRLPEMFRRWLADRETIHMEVTETSECGGGSEAVRWHPCGAVVVGVATDGHCWIIPGNETCPQIDNYEEPAREGYEY